MMIIFPHTNIGSCTKNRFVYPEHARVLRTCSCAKNMLSQNICVYPERVRVRRSYPHNYTMFGYSREPVHVPVHAPVPRTGLCAHDAAHSVAPHLDQATRRHSLLATATCEGEGLDQDTTTVAGGVTPPGHHMSQHAMLRAEMRTTTRPPQGCGRVTRPAHQTSQTTRYCYTQR